MRSAFLRLFLVALLLSAQHAALTHAIWHAHGAASSAQQTALRGADGGTGQAPERALCVFDIALGQVLGGAHGTTCHFCGCDAPVGVVVQSAPPRAGVLPLSFHSRAPPVLL